MNELFDIVTELLHAETCVVVPGFGGFVANRKPAQIDSATGRFCPPMVQVIFNAKLKHDDGLVAQAWAARKQCTLNEAAKQVAGIVDTLNNSLGEKGSVNVPQFGTFSCTAQGYSFVSAVSQDGFSEGYGLQEFYVPALKKDSSAAFAQIKKYVSAGIAAALATMLFIPFNTESLNNSMASFLPATQKTYSAAGTLNALASSATQMENAVTLLAAKLEKKAEKKQDEARFYIVLKRFANVEDATAFVQHHQDKMSDNLAVMAVCENFYCVTCANTKNPELAGKMMENVRSNSSFKETFILYK